MIAFLEHCECPLMADSRLSQTDNFGMLKVRN